MADYRGVREAVAAAIEKRRPGRPATGQVPTRSVRVGAVWDEAMKVSREQGETLHQVITRALEDYVRGAHG